MATRKPDPQLRQIDSELTGWSEPAARLRQALERDELALYCQPIAALSGRVRFPMAEVLVRLREEEKALLPPGEFIPVFEHYRLMPDLDRWVFRHILRHIAAGSRIARFSVNVSSQTLEDREFPAALAQEFRASRVPGGAIYFDIGEPDTLARLPAALRFATALRALGCGLMVGGFGRRSASFAALKALQPDFVKIDGSITRRILSHPSCEAKLRAIVRVAEVLRYRVVAEMVEEQDVLVRLKALGVGYVQGFGVRQPHPIELIAVGRKAPAPRA